MRLAGHGGGEGGCTYTFEEIQQVFPSLVADLLGAEFRARSHGGQLGAVGGGELRDRVSGGWVWMRDDGIEVRRWSFHLMTAIKWGASSHCSPR